MREALRYATPSRLKAGAVNRGEGKGQQSVFHVERPDVASGHKPFREFPPPRGGRLVGWLGFRVCRSAPSRGLVA